MSTATTASTPNSANRYLERANDQMRATRYTIGERADVVGLAAVAPPCLSLLALPRTHISVTGQPTK